MNNYIWYIVIFIVSIFAYYIFRIEPRLLKTENCFIHEGEDPLRMLQLSDLHLSDLKIKLEDINIIISRENPDVIVLTGDMMDNEADLVNLDNFLTSIECNCQIFLTLGNHDMKVIRSLNDIKEFKVLLEKFPNITLLHNEIATIKKGSRMFDIIGLTDTQSEFYSVQGVNDLVSSVHNNKIILTHNPDAACDIEPNSCLCIISGHLHGGQIWLPFNFEFTVLRKGCLPKQGYKHGLYLINGNRLYISRGIGTSLIPARFLSKPEITVFHL